MENFGLFFWAPDFDHLSKLKSEKQKSKTAPTTYTDTGKTSSEHLEVNLRLLTTFVPLLASALYHR